MSNYTVRVELHEAESNHYEKLHEEMKRRGFSRRVRINGVSYQLPTAEYSLVAVSNRQRVLKKAEAAANAVKPHPKPYILVTSSELPRVFSGLKRA